MTKLMEWMLVGFVVLASWVALNTGQANTPEWYYKWYPVVFVGVFGLYSVIVIMYRVFTFNNCESAAVELQKQIKEATKDLTAKGIKLKKSK